jgi:hypothetical protein
LVEDGQSWWMAAGEGGTRRRRWRPPPWPAASERGRARRVDEEGGEKGRSGDLSHDAEKGGSGGSEARF